MKYPEDPGHLSQDRSFAEVPGCQQPDPAKPMRFLRLGAVQDRTGLSRSSIYRLMGANDFPKAVRLATQGRGWLESEVDRWIAGRVAERDSAVEGWLAQAEVTPQGNRGAMTAIEQGPQCTSPIHKLS